MISLLLQVGPKARPTTDKILELPEVKERIEEYDIFRNIKEMNKSRVNSSVSRSMISHRDKTTINTNVTSEIGDSIAEMNRNLKGRKAPMQEIKEEENESKMVLETIRMPKKLIYLNKHLPTANYDTDQNEDEVNKIKNIKNLSFPNKMLPKIANNRYMNNILHNNNEIVKSAGDMKINTIHLKILKNNKGMFNLGKINTIIEEEEEIKKLDDMLKDIVEKSNKYS